MSTGSDQHGEARARRPQLGDSSRQVEALRGLLEPCSRALIITHDNPDPDSLAAALCLSHVLESFPDLNARIIYGGLIGRAENRNMVRALDIPVWSVANIKFRPDDRVILIDTQPAFTNNSLPEGRDVAAVIDHHPPAQEPDAPLVDIRPDYGAVTTVLTEYVVGSGVTIPSTLATAICYGIGTETQDLGREAADADVAAFLEAFPLCDQPLLGQLHHPQRSVTFLVELDRAIRAARILDGVLVSHLSAMPSPDAAAEMADMLTDVEDVEWAMCTGVYQDELIISLRTRDHSAHAGELLRGIVPESSQAGGHGMVAGGQIPLEKDQDPAEVREQVLEGLLEALGRDPAKQMKPLTSLPEVRKIAETEKEKGEPS